MEVLVLHDTQVLVLLSRRLVRPAADDDFVKSVYQSITMKIKKFTSEDRVAETIVKHSIKILRVIIKRNNALLLGDNK